MAVNREHERNGVLRRRFLTLLATGAAIGGLAGCVETPPYQSALPPPVGDEGPRSRPQLEQMLAPIALYPDALLAQVLMATTYPLEIVQAQRWLAAGGNARLRGTALEQALDGQSWDISVKSLVPFPEVLKRLNDNLEWTQRVGDAVLAQQQEVLAAIQVLRQRAQESGTLRSSSEQTVSVGAGPIVIEPAQSQIVYVPTYDTTVVYGVWPYPAYPPYAWPYGYGGVALAAGIGFAAGVAIAGGYWGWANPGWGGGDININSDRVRNVDRDRIRQDGGRWQHDARHRQGVGYRDQASRDRFQGNRGRDAAGREQFRGRAQQLPAGGNFQGRAQQQPAGGRQGGLDGIGRGGDVRAASDRGAASRGGSFGGGRPSGGYGGGGGFGGGGYGGGRGGYGGGGGFGGGGGGFRGGGGRGGRR